ncbi:unnamed protein product [Merluccius merluccius]
MSKRSVYFWVTTTTKTSSWVVLVVLLVLVLFAVQVQVQVQSLSLEVRKTYYDTLDVQKTATDRQIQKAFHRLAVKFHPDKNKSAEAETIFRDIVEAYEVLSDQDTRRMYDYLGHEAFLRDEKDFHDPEERPEEDFFHFDFDDFLSSLDLDPEDDEDFFMDEPHHNHWGFPVGSEDVEDPLEEQRILDSIFFDTHDHYFYAHEDEEESEHFY